MTSHSICRYRRSEPPRRDVAHRLSAYTYVFRTDVKRYYASIDHEILFSQLRKHITDSRVLAPPRLRPTGSPGRRQADRPKAWENKGQGNALDEGGKGKNLCPIRKPCKGATRECLWRPFRASKRRRKMEWLWMPITQGVALGYTV